MNDINLLRELLRSKGCCLDHYKVYPKCLIPANVNNTFKIPDGWLAVIYRVHFISAPAGKRYIVRSNSKYNLDMISGGNNTEWNQMEIFQSHIWVEGDNGKVPDNSPATIAVHFLLLEPICNK